MSLSSQELNYLIWRYLQESGFELTTFALQRESSAELLDERFSTTVPRGALVNLIQKGIQFIEIEAEVAKSRGEGRSGGDRLAHPYTVLSALSLSEDELNRLKEIEQSEEYDRDVNGVESTSAENVQHQRDGQGQEESREQDDQDKNQDKEPKDISQVQNKESQEVSQVRKETLKVQSEEPKSTDTIAILKIARSLEGSQNSQFNPVRAETLAYGTIEGSNIIIYTEDEQRAADEDVEMKDIADDSALAKISLGNSIIPPEDKDTTSLSWNPSGTLLAMGTFDGKIRLWTFDGKLRHVLSLHRAPILNIRFNQSGTLIGSIDCTGVVVIWEVNTGDIKEYHGEKVGVGEGASSAIPGISPTHNGSIDVNGGGTPNNDPTAANNDTSELQNGGDFDWIDDTTYVSTNNLSIFVYKVGEPRPLFAFNGHTQAINSLRFDTSTKLLASASDDYTIRIWHGKSPVSIFTLTGHTGPVMDIKWISREDQQHSNKSLLISSSVDSTIRVWDVSRGMCIATLGYHSSPIFALEVSPNKKYVASGSADGYLYVWSIEEVCEYDNTTPIVANRAIDIPCPKVGRYQIHDSSSDDVPPADTTVTSISWSLDSKLLFVGYGSSSVILKL